MPTNKLWWGSEAATQKKSLLSTDKKIEDALTKVKQDEDPAPLKLVQKTVRLLIKFITMFMTHGLDTPGFKDAFDQIETERLLAPVVQMNLPPHLESARIDMDVRGAEDPTRCSVFLVSVCVMLLLLCAPMFLVFF